MQDLLKPYQIRVSGVLNNLLPSEDTQPTKLTQAIRYMVLNDSSKRIRATLVYMIGDELSADNELLDIAAASVEMFHIFSLIHDDLPCIDNSDFRHHRPACHKAFNEATAVLAGDALIIHGMKAINIIGSELNHTAISVKLINVLTEALLSLVVGEHLDIEYTSAVASINQLNEMYNKKTTALINAAIQAGAIVANCEDPKIIMALKKFGHNIGLIFQIVDDIIDIESSTTVLGKPHGHDLDLAKSTYPSLIGIAESKLLVKTLYDEALQSLDSTGLEFVKLRALAQFITQRNY